MSTNFPKFEAFQKAMLFFDQCKRTHFPILMPNIMIQIDTGCKRCNNITQTESKKIVQSEKK